MPESPPQQRNSSATQDRLRKLKGVDALINSFRESPQKLKSLSLFKKRERRVIVPEVLHIVEALKARLELTPKTPFTPCPESNRLRFTQTPTNPRVGPGSYFVQSLPPVRKSLSQCKPNTEKVLQIRNGNLQQCIQHNSRIDRLRVERHNHARKLLDAKRDAFLQVHYKSDWKFAAKRLQEWKKSFLELLIIVGAANCSRFQIQLKKRQKAEARRLLRLFAQFAIIKVQLRRQLKGARQRLYYKVLF